MIAPLRKRHRIIWVLWGIFLPIAFIIITQKLQDAKFSPPKDADITEVLEVTKFDQEKLIIQLHTGIRSAYSTIKVGNKEGKIQTLGVVGPAGIYEFKLDSGFIPGLIILYDELKNKELYKQDI